VSTTISTDRSERARSLAQEAREFALAHGVLRSDRDGGIVHLPISLMPWQADAAFVTEVQETTLLYNRLYHDVAGQRAFLEEHLAQAREADDFVKNLFASLAPQPVAKPLLYMNRNDGMPNGSQPKQVEMNLMAAALGFMSEKVNHMHRFLYPELADQLVPCPVKAGLLSALARGHKAFGDPQAAVVFVTLPGEVNVFELRVTEAALRLEHGVPTRRTSLEELGQLAEIKGGDLWFKGAKVAIVYFRAGYAPDHYPNATAWKARSLIEASTAISVPACATQLANTKKIQQVLSRRPLLEQFVQGATADRLHRSMVAFSPLDEEVSWLGKSGPAREVAAAFPADWVLKPYREGGGNNFFDQEMVSRLRTLTPEESRAYILMERIKQPSFTGVRLVQNEVVEGPCVTEMGFFGIALYQPGAAEPEFNEHCGYLLRTKDEANAEGLVLGGYSFLDAAVTD